MAKAEELKKLDAFTTLLGDVRETLPTWTDMPYDLFTASAKVCEGLYEWAVKKRAAHVAEATCARDPGPTPAPREPGNDPERKPDKGWVWPGLERPAERKRRMISDADQDATEPLAPAAESPQDPKAGTV